MCLIKYFAFLFLFGFAFVFFAFVFFFGGRVGGERASYSFLAWTFSASSDFFLTLLYCTFCVSSTFQFFRPTTSSWASLLFEFLRTIAFFFSKYGMYLLWETLWFHTLINGEFLYSTNALMSLNACLAISSVPPYECQMLSYFLHIPSLLMLDHDRSQDTN